MNYTPLEDAYKSHHTNSNIYTNNITYSPICIYCKNTSSKALMNDGGSFRQCDKCRKNFRAIVIDKAIHNFCYSTSHLKGTN